MLTRGIHETFSHSLVSSYSFPLSDSFKYVTAITFIYFRFAVSLAVRSVASAVSRISEQTWLDRIDVGAMTDRRFTSTGICPIIPNNRRGILESNTYCRNDLAIDRLVVTKPIYQSFQSLISQYSIYLINYQHLNCWYLLDILWYSWGESCFIENIKDTLCKIFKRHEIPHFLFFLFKFDCHKLFYIFELSSMFANACLKVTCKKIHKIF